MKHVRYLLLVVAIATTALARAEEYNIIPQPRSIVQGAGTFTLGRGAKIGCADMELLPAARYLAEHLHVGVSYNGGAIRLERDVELRSEEYRLTIADGGIVICGGDYGGVFNGIQTLIQLFSAEVYDGGCPLPATLAHCTIEDSPRWSHRGFMLDVCRTWMDVDAVKAFIDLLAYHKINNLRLHLTDDEAWRIAIESHPELAREGGFRGGDAKIWPRYGKWNERWGGYYTKEDIAEMVAYAKVRNITIIPEIDLPGHSLCIATLHPEILCRYTPNTSRAYGYDTRSAFCPAREENYALIEDILTEVCAMFPSRYIHVGGDEVDMSQWRRCPDCQALMSREGMTSTAELQQYFMSRISSILSDNGKLPAVWNEAIDGGRLNRNTRVYGWEGIKECRAAAAEGYDVVVMPGHYFYFDMKQTPREPGHDWAAIFDWSKVYGFSPKSVGFTATEQEHIVGIEASFFSEAYASRNPESADYLHYQTFPRMVALAEVAWTEGDERDEDAFYERIVAHYDRLDAMGVAYRLMPPMVEYRDGVLIASVDDGSAIYYTCEGDAEERLYSEPLSTSVPARYAFRSRRGGAMSPVAAVEAHFRTIVPPFRLTSSMPASEKFSFVKAEGYGRLARTTRAADIGDWLMYTFDSPVKCRRMKVATGNFQLPRFTFENGYVEVSYDGVTFEYLGELVCGMYTIECPSQAIKAVRITSTSRGNGAEWVSIQPPTIWPLLPVE
ncbi:MAG: beta-N-acetylhexosaminidase [Alistipes sp.]|nr:beta-N-acetylhexosaminidase [Alistipes sp.]